MGKIAIIMYAFAIGLLFAGYYVDLTFGEDMFTGVTYDSLDAIANKNEVNANVSADLIFGDFIAGVQVLFGIITGDTIAQAFALLPNFLEVWTLLVRIVFTLSSALLWIYIITGRSL